jgi:hypothetical protein
MSGTLEYAITYGFVGSRLVHHSRKKMSFDLYYSQSLGGNYVTLDEYED